MLCIKKHLQIAVLILFCGFIVGCSRSRKANPIMHLSVISESDGVGFGTAFVGRYRNRDFIITAAHIVRNTDSILINDESGKILSSVSTYICPNSSDIAILFPDKNIEFSHSYKLYGGPIKDNYTLLSIGYAYGLNSLKYSCGRYVANTLINIGSCKSETIATTCELNPGMSGGPLFYKNKVVAINSAIVKPIGIRIAKDKKSLQLKGLHISIKELLPTLDRIINK